MTAADRQSLLGNLRVTAPDTLWLTVILIARTWAIFNHNKKVLVFLIILILAIWVPSLYFLQLHLNSVRCMCWMACSCKRGFLNATLNSCTDACTKRAWMFAHTREPYSFWVLCASDRIRNGWGSSRLDQATVFMMACLAVIFVFTLVQAMRSCVFTCSHIGFYIIAHNSKQTVKTISLLFGLRCTETVRQSYATAALSAALILLQGCCFISTSSVCTPKLMQPNIFWIFLVAFSVFNVVMLKTLVRQSLHKTTVFTGSNPFIARFCCLASSSSSFCTLYPHSPQPPRCFFK
jgi:hypothetical protein